jgi:hypothetical protein
MNESDEASPDRWFNQQLLSRWQERIKVRGPLPSYMPLQYRPAHIGPVRKRAENILEWLQTFVSDLLSASFGYHWLLYHRIDPDQPAMVIVAVGLRVTWFSLVIGIPLYLLFRHLGWSKSFKTGEAFLFVIGLFTGVFAERFLEQIKVNRTSREPSVAHRVREYGPIFLALFLIFLGLKYVFDKRQGGTVNTVEVVWFSIALWVAYLLRNPGSAIRPLKRDAAEPSRVVGHGGDA